MPQKIKSSDPRLFRVKLIQKMDVTEEGDMRQRQVRNLVAQILLLGKQRGRPRKLVESDNAAEEV